MYSTKSLNGFPAIQRNGRGVLSVWNKDWEFANWLCDLLNALDDSPELLLNEFDRQWLTDLDLAFSGKRQDARCERHEDGFDRSSLHMMDW